MSSQLEDVIMMVYGRCDVAKDTIVRAIQKAGCQFRLIVVDDGSNESSFKEFVMNLPVPATYVQHDQNWGIGVSLNDGVRNVKPESEWFTVIDSDIDFEDAWLLKVKNARKLFSEDAQFGGKVAWIGFRVVDANNKMVFFYRMLDNFGQTLFVPTSTDPSDKENLGSVVCTAPAAPCYTFKKDAFLAIGGADNSLRKQWIDADLGVRLNKAGFGAIATSLMSVVHLVSHEDNREDVLDFVYYSRKWGSGL